MCQDVTGAAGLFFARLAKYGYEGTTDTAAGAIAQAIQSSAYPTRYAARMSEAQALYDRLATIDTTPTPVPGKQFPADWSDREILVEILRQLRGPTLDGWAQLGGRTLIDAVAALALAAAGAPAVDAATNALAGIENTNPEILTAVLDQIGA